MLLDVGESHVELIAPLGPETGVAKFIAKNGPGLHHVAYQVEDIEAEIARLVAAGIQMIDAEPRTGIRGSRVAFMHPKSTARVLTELTEPAKGATNGTHLDRILRRPDAGAARGGRRPEGAHHGTRRRRLA